MKRILPILAVLLLTAACGSSIPSTPTGPSLPADKTTGGGGTQTTEQAIIVGPERTWPATITLHVNDYFNVTPSWMPAKCTAQNPQNDCGDWGWDPSASFYYIEKEKVPAQARWRWQFIHTHPGMIMTFTTNVWDHGTLVKTNYKVTVKVIE